MMFMTLTHDNQSTLSSFTQFLSFVTNSPVSEKPFLAPLMWAWL